MAPPHTHRSLLTLPPLHHPTVKASCAERGSLTRLAVSCFHYFAHSYRCLHSVSRSLRLDLFQDLFFSVMPGPVSLRPALYTSTQTSTITLEALHFLLHQGSANIFCRGSERVNTFTFVGHTVPVTATTQLFCDSAKWLWMVCIWNQWAWVCAHKNWFSKTGIGPIWPTVNGLSLSVLGYRVFGIPTMIYVSISRCYHMAGVQKMIVCWIHDSSPDVLRCKLRQFPFPLVF